jgi:HEAT repeat protein
MNTPQIHRYNGLFALLIFFGCCIGGCSGTKTPLFSMQGDSIENLAGQAVKIVQAALEDVDPQVRTNAVEVVATTGTVDLMPRVEQLLADEFVPVRFAAALAIGDTRYAPAKIRLNQLLKASDENTALAAAYALYKLGDETKFSIVAERLKSKDTNVRANAVLLLGKCGSENGIPLLWRAMEAKDSDDKVRLQAAESLARLGDEKIYPKLWTIVLNINADVRILGVLAMGALGTEQAKGAITTQLSDQVLEVRLVAAGQLGKLGDKTGEPEVLEVFTKNLTGGMDRQGAERVNSLAAEAIGQIKTPELTKYLPKLVKNESKLVKLAAARAVLLCQSLKY